MYVKDCIECRSKLQQSVFVCFTVDLLPLKLLEHIRADQYRRAKGTNCGTSNVNVVHCVTSYVLLIMYQCNYLYIV